MTPEQIAAIEARLAAATPGPWIVEDDDGHWYIYGPDGFQIHNLFNSALRGRAVAEGNRLLIANAPTDIRALLDANAAAVVRAERLERMIHAYNRAKLGSVEEVSALLAIEAQGTGEEPTP